MKSGVGKWQGRGVFSGRYLNLSSGVCPGDTENKLSTLLLSSPCAGQKYTLSKDIPPAPVFWLVHRLPTMSHCPSQHHGRSPRHRHYSRTRPTLSPSTPLWSNDVATGPARHAIGTGDPHRPSRTLSCIWQSVMPKQQTICILKHFIATTKTATSPESPTVTSP